MNRSWPIVAGLAVLLGLALAVWRLGSWSAVPRPLKSLSIDTPPVAPIAISPDGSRLVHTIRERGEVVLQVRSVDGTDRLRLRGARGAIAPFFSSDGTWIGFVADDALRKVPASGGRVQVVTPLLHEDFAGASWTDRDEIIYATTSGLHRVAADGGSASLLLSPVDDEREFRWPDAVGGSGFFLFEVALDTGTSRVEALSLDTGERRMVLREASLPRYARSGHLLFVRGQALWGVAFDPDRMEVAGQPRVLVPPDRPVERIWYAISGNGTLVLGYPASNGPSLFTLVLHWEGELDRLAPADTKGR
jgi:hypothetical protein